MTEDTLHEAHRLVAEVRAKAAAHRISWEAMVPTSLEMNLAFEPVEEAAYAEMARAKAELRHHVCETYGITARELAALALP